MKMRNLLAVAGLALLASAARAANTWYVDAGHVGLAGRDGRTEATAWGTLQEAHDAASAGDTIYLMPGVYCEGVTNDVGQSRLSVSKKLYFRAKSGNAKDTVILGAKDPSTLDNSSFPGVGPKAVRCLRLSSGSKGSEFHHITFRGGATTNEWVYKDFDATSTGHGGCISCATSSFFVDCVIEQGVAIGVGGGIVAGTDVGNCCLVRCVVDGCYGTSWGAAVTRCNLFCSIVSNVRNSKGDRPAVAWGHIVNCSLYGIYGTGLDKGAHAYNTVFGYTSSSAAGNASGGATLYNCYSKADLKSDTDNFYRCFLAPAARDYRLLPGTAAVNGGRTEYLTGRFDLPPGTSVTDFNGNAIDMTSETCHAGAVQDVTTPVGGRIDLYAGAVLNGYTNTMASYVYADRWPNAFRLADTRANFLRYEAGGNYNKMLGSFLYPDPTGSLRVTTPPPDRPDDVFTPVAKTWSVRYWCDPQAASDGADGTEEHPFPTLQGAVDAAVANGDSVVLILARPGDYRTGGKTFHGCTCRLMIPASLVPIIRSTGGASVTFITGEADPNPPDAAYPGCGPNAVRCVGAEADWSNRMLQGFTLRDGHTNVPNADPSDGHCESGAAVFGSSDQAFHVLDCVITNCHGGSSFAISRYATFNRCRFVDCASPGTLFGYGYLVASTVDPSCASTGDGPGVVGAHSGVYFCTIPKASFKTSSSDSSTLVGTLVGDGSLTGFKGTCIANFENPQYVNDAAWGDFRLMASTPASSGCQGLADDDRLLLQDIFCSNVRGDVDTRDYLTATGTSVPLSGAVQELVKGVYVGVATGGGFEVAGGTTGRGYLPDELPLVLRALTPSRPFLGFAVNGVTNDFPASGEMTFAAADLAAADGALGVLPCYTSEWYVDAAGSDANTGFKPTAARRTLATLLEDARLAAGDTVHLAAGRYDSGVNVAEGRRYRAAVPAGVALLGAGQDATVIAGARDTDAATADANGFGAGAVRGVLLAAGSSVGNLTIADCWTEQGGKGAGVVSAVAENLTYHPEFCVRDCLITNCWAGSNGGGACNVRLIRCRLIGNRSVAAGGSTYLCELFGCLTDHSYQGSANTSSANHMFMQAVQSTLGANNWTFDGTVRTAAVGNQVSWGLASPLKNCLILGCIRIIGTPAVGCIYADTILSGYEENFTNCRKATLEEINLDAAYRPQVGASVAVDAASNTVYETCRAVLGETDLYGTQRIYNGTVDVGAVEGDWRDHYARAFCRGRRLKVTEASPDVVEKDGVVTLAPGCILRAVNTGTRACDYTVAVKVAGTSAAVGWGADARNVAAGSSVQTLSFGMVAPEAVLAFDNTANDGDLEIVSAACLSGLAIHVR